MNQKPHTDCTGDEQGKASAFTPGPWMWEVTPHGEVRLTTPDRGRLYVMGVSRKGMHGATARFSLWGEGERGRRGGIMHDFVEAGGANHPDARLIAAAPALFAKVQQYASECGECEGRGYVVRYHDPYGHGDVASPEHHDCEACADIRTLLRQAGSAAP